MLVPNRLPPFEGAGAEAGEPKRPEDDAPVEAGAPKVNLGGSGMAIGDCRLLQGRLSVLLVLLSRVNFSSHAWTAHCNNSI